MAAQTALAAWKQAKDKFEDAANKKRPGDPKKAGLLAKWLTKFKAETGLTPLCTAYDKAYAECGPNQLQKDVSGRVKRVQVFENAADSLRTQLKAYLEILKKQIQKELPDDISPEVLRAYENLSSNVEMISKMVKVSQLQVRAAMQQIDGGKGAELGSYLGNLVSMHKSIEKAVIGMEAMVKNIKAAPTFGNYMKVLSSDPPTRWMTTQYKLLRLMYKKVEGLEAEIKVDPVALEKTLNDFGAEHGDNWWREKIGNRDERVAILAFAEVIEHEIANAKRVAIRMKAFAQKFKQE